MKPLSARKGSSPLLILLASTGALAAFPDCVHGPLSKNLVCDTSSNFVDRAKALVAEFTVAEMINNTGYDTPGVPRLGLPPYAWWSEALHGVASSPGVTFAPPGNNFSFATSFPAPILTSAAFDDQLVNDVASIISTEARAFNNFGDAGLSFFTPNINPFKDPRWGRGQETPGEDPFHIGRYAYHLVTGLQGGLGSQLSGTDRKYLKIIADCKHYAAYDLENWEGNSRMAFDAIVSTQDLAEFYSPSFQSCVRDAQVASIMCSYNSVNGIPSCASEYLMQNITRDFFDLGENQWITSDCDAVGNIFDPHDYTDTLVNASAVALHAGTDIDCGTTYSSTLQSALDEGLVEESEIVQAMVRRYGSLVRLGYFDSPEIQPYRQLNWDNVNTLTAQTLAYTAAIEGITLLKNDGTLPLSPSITSVALIGPWANATTQMQSNYNGVAPFLISPLDAFHTAGFNVTFSSGTTISGTDTSGFDAAIAAARSADLVVFVGGIDDTIEAEGMDRVEISWPGNQLQLIMELASVEKPFVVLQMGGGQVDSSDIRANDSINALIWGGYPGQSGGTALVDILTGKQAPTGRLPVTQYPADYVNQIPMTDMTLRPSSTSPGRTYKWYTGEVVFPFGFGLHYTNFSLEWAKPPQRSYNIQSLMFAAKSGGGPIDLALLDRTPFELTVKNTGSVTSDYTALLFSNTTAGPTPAPLKQLVGYTRVKSIAAGQSATAQLNVTLGSIARVEENGDSALYPGTYKIWVDTDVNGKGVAATSFELTGSREVLSEWPQP
ncbi:glycoside hydrolase family 3 protein [Lentinula aciculospora]|uniref:xylan 1,4-beta-xylosidase n=1 Tax=Lentinula aciculospora TaxID=153920 RepID=A0A9W9AT37_9AGAR|nr:glycoside hydrolase family 3 protein [Lentinula aciculospora]